jgi:hypothetical protein
VTYSHHHCSAVDLDHSGLKWAISANALREPTWKSGRDTAYTFVAKVCARIHTVSQVNTQFVANPDPRCQGKVRIHKNSFEVKLRAAWWDLRKVRRIVTTRHRRPPLRRWGGQPEWSSAPPYGTSRALVVNCMWTWRRSRGPSPRLGWRNTQTTETTPFAVGVEPSTPIARIATVLLN